MQSNKECCVNGEMLVRYYELNKKKKEIELELNELKEVFQQYFNQLIGTDSKGEITLSGYKLQRQIRRTEKFKEEDTVRRLEDLQLNDLIQIVKRPDDAKIKAALQLGLLNQDHLSDCLTTTVTSAISVKPITPR